MTTAIILTRAPALTLAAAQMLACLTLPRDLVGHVAAPVTLEWPRQARR